MKSILFTDEMVRAILAGRKTKTRRPLTPQPDDDAKIMIGEVGSSKGVAYIGDSTSGGHVTRVVSPFGKVGDRLWVREAFMLTVPNEKPMYRATWKNPDGIKWKPSLHMPRWASRITLEITDIRVERVREITEEEAEAEGARKFTNLPPDPSLYPYGNEPRWSMEEPKSLRECLGSARYAFANLWERMYAKKGLGWNANPWVWVIGFRRVEG